MIQIHIWKNIHILKRDSFQIQILKSSGLCVEKRKLIKLNFWMQTTELSVGLEIFYFG